MQITKVNFYKNENEDEEKILGTASVCFDYNFVVKDITVMTGNKGVYLSFPMDKTGRYLAFPSTEESRQKVLNAIVDKMKEE